VPEATEQLQEFGIEAPAFGSAEALLAADLDLDGVAILSPSALHQEHLHLALQAGLHTLCEKPLLDSGTRDQGLIEAFGQSGLLLMENCQWPAAVAALGDQDERFRGSPCATFAMGLAPEGRGVVLLEESLSHPISILQECLGPDLELSRPHWEWNPDQSAVILTMQAEAGVHSIGVRVELCCTALRPRPAWIDFDGLRAEREVDGNDYSIHFRVPERLISIPDPLTTHLAHFTHLLRATMGGCAPPDQAPLIQRAALFEALIQDANRHLP
jgi:hypothetical protein